MSQETVKSIGSLVQLCKVFLMWFRSGVGNIYFPEAIVFGYMQSGTTKYLDSDTQWI